MLCYWAPPIHGIQARGGVVRAYPETCVAAQRSLRDFVRHVLSLVCETKSAGDDVDGMDVQRALARVAVRPAEFRPAYVYPFDGEGADSDGDECAFAFAADHVEGDDDAGVMGEGARCWFVSPTCGAMLTRTSGDAEFVAPDAPDDAMEVTQIDLHAVCKCPDTRGVQDDVLRAQMVAAAEGDRNHSVLNPHGITRWTHRTLDPFGVLRCGRVLDQSALTGAQTTRAVHICSPSTTIRRASAYIASAACPARMTKTANTSTRRTSTTRNSMATVVRAACFVATSTCSLTVCVCRWTVQWWPELSAVVVRGAYASCQRDCCFDADTVR